MEKKLTWIEIATKNQDSCVIDSDKTTQYFKLQEGAQQGDSISAYLFILALAVLFYLIKNNMLIKNLEICDYHFIYSAYTDDTSFKK